jgi:molybdopterin-containing oxidoreductase family membrane subunit
VGVVIGMWLERYLIVVPSLEHKFMPYAWGKYEPRPTEIVITIATFAAMTLLYTLFAKFIPIISIWEMKAGEHPPEDLMAAAEQRLGETHA